MLSRVAESIYWMARYVERAEYISRFIEVTLAMTLDLPEGIGSQWQPLVLTTGDEFIFAKRYPAPTREHVIQFLVFDEQYGNSMITSLRIARENARTIREAISSEAWEALNEFYLLVTDQPQQSQSLHELTDFFHAVRQHSYLFHGVLDATMLRGEGWHFANLGRLLERADQTSRILDVKYFSLLPQVDDVGTTLEDLQWSAVLKSVSGLEMYRKRYHAITLQRVVEFLILDPLFPRAIHYCVAQAHDSLLAVSPAPGRTVRNLPEQRLSRLHAEFQQADVHAIVATGLHQYVDRLQVNLNSVGDAIAETFFP